MVLVFAQEYRAPSIDHDHVTGLARGVLCQSCNLRVGWFEQAVRHGSGVVVAQQRDGFAAKIAAYLQAHAKEHREGR